MTNTPKSEYKRGDGLALRLTVALTSTELLQIDDLALLEGRTRSNMARRLLKFAIGKHAEANLAKSA